MEVMEVMLHRLHVSGGLRTPGRLPKHAPARWLGVFSVGKARQGREHVHLVSPV
jgi:hypothetical protein